MRKRILTITLVILVFMSLFTSCSDAEKHADTFRVSLSTANSAESVQKPGELTEEVRGVWIASVYNINFPSAPDLSATQLRRELDDILKTVLDANMNTIYLQVHPASDALYKSDIFPVSRFLYTDGKLDFDPLEYMVEKCHKNGVALYAWLNPLRVSTAAYDSEKEAMAALPDSSPCKDAGITTFFDDGKLYLNCGSDDARKLVADAVGEIASGYDVDGIVFDDYFYPYPVYDDSGKLAVFDDAAEYAASETKLSLEDWRRENVNQLVKSCYDRIKSINSDIRFGVAPFGIWRNDDGSGAGSATSGMEAYSELFCDATAWIRGGYVDFISPQLYWECDSIAAPFGELMRFWNTETSGTGVDLIISHGLYRYDNDWDNPSGELPRQVEVAREYLSYKGSMLYGYAALKKNVANAANDTAESFSDSVYYYSPSPIKDGIIIDMENDTYISDGTVHISGYSDPAFALTVNGQSISRSMGGYFRCELKLSEKKNEFVFVCGDNSETITVYNNS